MARALSTTSVSGPRTRVLILGTRAVARPIARQLMELGFEAVVHRDESRPLPYPADGDALPALRRELERFVRESGPALEGSHLVHPGVSAWAERPELSTVAQELGLGVICPPVRVLSLFGNRLNFLHEADRLGVPTLVMGFDPIQSVREVEALMSKAGRAYPFVLKSVRGGGGFGLLVVHEPADLEKNLPLWLEQLRVCHGEAIAFAERYAEGARHVVVPFARFRDGRTEIFPMTDASLQSRYRKVVEFCPVGRLEPGVDRRLREWTELLAEKTGFVGVGSLEFLVDVSRAYLLGGAARLDTGFELWERCAGTRAVEWQLAAQLGADPTVPLPARSSDKAWAAGVALQLHAEDPLLQLPRPGLVRELSDKREWKLPGAEGLLSPGVEPGERVDFSGDGLVGLVLAGAADRKRSATVARGILDELWISGSVQTNERFLAELLLHPWVREGIFHAGFVDEEFVPELRPPRDVLEASAAACFQASGADLPGAFVAGDQRVRPQPGALRWTEGPNFWEHAGKRGVSGRVELQERGVLRISVFPSADGLWQVRCGPWFVPVRQPRPRSGASRHRLSALVGGRVHSLLFREGVAVEPHAPMAVVESLRMLVPHAVPIGVKVARWLVRAEDEVVAGQELAELDTAP